MQVACRGCYISTVFVVLISNTISAISTVDFLYCLMQPSHEPLQYLIYLRVTASKFISCPKITLSLAYKHFYSSQIK